MIYSSKLLIAIALLFAFSPLLNQCADSTRTASNDPASEVVLRCEDAIKGNLPSPDSAEFPSVQPIRENDGSWTVDTYVDTQTPSGELRRTNWLCRVSGETGEVTLIPID